MSGKLSPLPAKWKHRFAWRRPNKLKLGLHIVVTIAEHACDHVLTRVLKLLTYRLKCFLWNMNTYDHFNYVKTKAYVESLKNVFYNMCLRSLRLIWRPGFNLGNLPLLHHSTAVQQWSARLWKVKFTIIRQTHILRNRLTCINLKLISLADHRSFFLTDSVYQVPTLQYFDKANFQPIVTVFW